MEDIKRSLTSSCGSSSKLEAVSHLYSKIVTGSETEQEAGLKVLWSHLGSGDCLTSQACADLVVVLVRAARLEVSSTITQLLACLSQGQQYSGLVPALGQLLILQYRRRQQHYSISSSQHPLLSVLRSTPATWSLVLDVMNLILHHPDHDIKDNAVNILRPVLLYLFCDPNHHIHFAAIRAALLETLLQLAEEDVSVKVFLLEMLDWLKLDNKASLQESSLYIYRVVGLCLRQADYQRLTETGKLYILVSLALHQARAGYSISSSLNLLDSLVTLSLEGKVLVCWDLVLVMLEQVVESSCHTHHPAILRLALRLVTECEVTRLATGVLVTSLLHSLSLPSHLPASANTKAELVRKFYSKTWPDPASQPDPGLVRAADCDVITALATVRLCRQLDQSSEETERWLTDLAQHPTSHLSELRPLLAGLLLCSRQSKTAGLCLELLVRCVRASSSSSSVLALILHCLADTETEPEVKLALLQSLPSLAADRTCISLILGLLSSLAPKPSFAPLRLSLLYKLWRVEARVFPYLQKALLESPSQASSHSLEFQTGQAAVIRDVVSSHASQYGSDLLPVLSNILNQCTAPEGSTACKLALQGIKTLCQQSVIDMKTTVRVLAPKVARDPRPAVLTAYISLLGLAPTFDLAGSEYQAFLCETAGWLWQTVNTTEVREVREACYLALAHFTLETTQLRMLPLRAREGLKLPAKYCSTPEEASRRPEDVLPYVPSECWARLILSDAHSKVLLRSLVKLEVEGLPRAVYSLSQSMQSSGSEPVNYSHLPELSVLRGLVQAVFEAAASRRDLPRHPSQLERENTALLPLLALLATDYGRPLPPLDWTGLEPLLAEAGGLRPAVISVLARQAATSRTARIILERQLRTDSLDREVVMEYFLQLPLLVSSVSQQTMSGWLARSLNTTTNTGDLRRMLAGLASALQSDKVGEAGLEVVGLAVEGLHDKITVEEEDLYQQYLLTVSSLPANTVERLTSPSLWWEITPDKLYKAAGLRATLVISQETDTPLTWFNEILEVTARQPGDKSFLLSHLLRVLTKYRAEKTKHMSRSWLLELMGQISAQLRSANSQSVSFLLAVFSLAVIIMTETDSLLLTRQELSESCEARLELLPLAVCRLCLHQPNISSPLSDWTFQLLNTNLTPDNYRAALRQTSKLFKYSTSWPEATMWGKLVMMK